MINDYLREDYIDYAQFQRLTEDGVCYVTKREMWSKGVKKSVVLLSNNFELSTEDITEICRRKWAIETLYKQLKQNFPLHFFYGDSVNAIQLQTWVVLIAHLLSTIIQRMIKRHCSFSQVVTMLRITLMYYTYFFGFMENPNKEEQIIMAEQINSPPKYSLFPNL